MFVIFTPSMPLLLTCQSGAGAQAAIGADELAGGLFVALELPLQPSHRHLGEGAAVRFAGRYRDGRSARARRGTPAPRGARSRLPHSHRRRRPARQTDVEHGNAFKRLEVGLVGAGRRPSSSCGPPAGKVPLFQTPSVVTRGSWAASIACRPPHDWPITAIFFGIQTSFVLAALAVVLRDRPVDGVDAAACAVVWDGRALPSPSCPRLHQRRPANRAPARRA
jgi:hypothetical protein